MTDGMAKQDLAGGLTNYGDPDFALYLRRSFARSMGFSTEMLDRPVIGVATSGGDFNNCHRLMPELVDAVKRGVLAAGGLPLDFPTISLGESFFESNEPDVPQPDGDGCRGDDPGAAHGCGGAHRRMRQDRPGAAYGRDLGRQDGDSACDGADDDRALPGRASRGLHRLPSVLGALPGRGNRSR